MRLSSSPFKTFTVAATAFVVVAASMPEPAFAKKLGGGSSIGRQQSGISQRNADPASRSTPPASTPSQSAAPQGAGAAPGSTATPATPAAAPGAASSPVAAQKPAAAPGQTPAAPAQPSGASRWLGPLAGIAAGVGLAALFSHLGLGAELASFVGTLLMVLLAVFAGLFIFRMIARSRQQPGMQRDNLAYGAAGSAGTASGSEPGRWSAEPQSRPVATERTGFSGPASATPLGTELNAYGQPVPSLNGQPTGFDVPEADAPLIDPPPGFDTAGFLRAARGVFVKLQAANDQGDVATLREFVSDDLLAIFRDEINTRGGAAQTTEVIALEAELVAYERDFDEHIASVLFSGSLREAAGQPAEGFQEIWNLSRPVRQSGGWTLVGIQSL